DRECAIGWPKTAWRDSDMAAPCVGGSGRGGGATASTPRGHGECTPWSRGVLATNRAGRPRVRRWAPGATGPRMPPVELAGAASAASPCFSGAVAKKLADEAAPTRGRGRLAFAQPARGVEGEVGQHAVGAGALEAQQRFQRALAFVQPAVGESR